MADRPAPESSAARALVEAAAAVVQEHREASRVVLLRCHDVTCVRQHELVTVFRLDVGGRVELDWTWEGSSAWQEARGSAVEPDAVARAAEERADDKAGEVDSMVTETGGVERAVERAVAWRGEVVGVDAVQGQIWVAVEGATGAPAVGPLSLGPFPFLQTLRLVYAGSWPLALRARLPAALHRALRPPASPTPEPAPAAAVSVPPPFDALWGYRWSCLWGPPGTGKTSATGEVVAERLLAGSGRMLIVSTTNKATDAVALAIGRALLRRGADLADVGAVRAGRAADYDAFKAAGLVAMLDGGDSAARMRLAELEAALRRAVDTKERAWLLALRRRALREVESRPGSLALATEVRALITTVHAAVALLGEEAIVEQLMANAPTFDTVIVDEAGQVARAVVAALSLLAGERTILVGDPRQLAPIARLCRVLPPEQARWLAESGLGFLRTGELDSRGTVMLKVQHRMHPDVRAVVSRYQYDDVLEDGAGVGLDEAPLSAQLHKVPRAVWYVLDEESDSLAATRAERGPGNRSWVRPLTATVLAKLFAAMPEMRAGPGLFLAPFVAQARVMRRYFVEQGLTGWSASTVHAQQGVEAEFVIFDTVHAGAHVWPNVEWQRLINVALSRARGFAFVLASRHEMQAPFLAPLATLLQPRCLQERSGTTPRWRTPPVEPAFVADTVAEASGDPTSLGAQIAARRALPPLLSRDQQRLCELPMDGKPRLVRGVAGSGKTIVLAHWLVQVVVMLRAQPDARVWVVYANRALRGLIEDHVVEAWHRVSAANAFPWHSVEVWHVRDLLRDLYRVHQAGEADFGFDYERGADQLARTAGERIEPLCDALFVDEAQDLGHATLRLLTRIVRTDRAAEAGAKNVIVFYDNAQNVYRRGTPTWAELGLDMRGRSTVLKESFRGTRPIAEFALNVLYRLERADLDPDHRELLRRGLIEPTVRRGRRYYKARFIQVEGPLPQVRVFADRQAELAAVGERLQTWIAQEGVLPSDIKILYAGRDVAGAALQALQPVVERFGARLAVQTSEAFARVRDAVVVTTPHSFKGYDAEIVVVLGAERFVAAGGPLGYPLYVALTRARSLLEVFAQTGGASAAGLGVLAELQRSADDLGCADDDPLGYASQDDLEWVLGRLGDDHRAWLLDLAERHVLRFEPVLGAGNEILATPLFTFDRAGKLHACLDPADASERRREILADAGVVVVAPP